MSSVIVNGARTPMGRLLGALKDFSAVQLGGVAIRAALERSGVAPEQVVLDPGLGFAKCGEHNWALLAHLDRLIDLGRPLLVGASRKSFLGALLGEHGSESGARPPADRDDATAALTVVAAQAGAWAVRVHAVRASADAVRVVQRLRTEESTS